MGKLEIKLKKLPLEPGVYFHKNSRGKIIYVGKAAKLRQRVRQYFQKSRMRDAKTDALVAEIADVEWITTDSEIDALFLEAELIKRYKPQYNIALRDDKSDIYVRVDEKDDHPTISYTRTPMDDRAEYFGPFHHAPQVKRAMRYLRRVFPYDLKESKAKRVSLDYHLGLSPGLEQGKTDIEEYRSNIRKVKMYLKGNRVLLLKDIEKEMKAASKAQEFERAAVLRNQLKNLRMLHQQIVFGDDEFMDLSKDRAMSGLAKLLDLKSPPTRIEGYDISHMSGTDNVASMVVFSNGIPNKREYRKFKMRLPGNDDFAHMHEVISRRFRGRNLEQWPKPDLIIIDGGKGQLSSAQKAMKERGIEIPAIGLAKKYEDIIVKTDEGSETIMLDNNSHIIKLLQRIRDESHRFAVSYHSTLKTKRQTTSALDDIPGVGAKTRQKLLRKFGSYKKIQEASIREIQKVVGEKTGAVVFKHLYVSK